VPGWHEKLKPSLEKGDVVELGLIQEQHPDRCKLFMQWKQMDWPIMVDSLNLLGVKVVPITLFIDEHGVIRNVKPKHDELAEFLATKHAKPKIATPLAEQPGIESVKRLKLAVNEAKPATADGARERRDLADQMFLWLQPDDSEIVSAWYRQVLEFAPEDGDAHFRRGVALRRAYDLPDSDAELFGEAVQSWERSLEIDPNHYIRRRRIQQYGPRLDKPYSFYDWINDARKDIKARGETPAELVVEPSGAEFAFPDKEIKEAPAARNPDPEGKNNPDQQGLIALDAVPVPGKLKAGEASRVHVTLNVNAKRKAHWNNESGESVIWVNAPEGWVIEGQLFALKNGEGATDKAERKVEFELRAPKDAAAGSVTLTGYALYYVCEGADGTCLYLRQDFEVELEVR
jgi:hypothetical protein